MPEIQPEAHLEDIEAARGRTDRSDADALSDFSTASDEDFRETLRARLLEHPLAADYPDLFARAPDCFVRWRQRFLATNLKLWRRLFSADKVVKEFVEAVPVLDAVVKMIENDTRLGEAKNGTRQSYTIIDLCSGKGYLGMILSEVLPPSKVFRIVLMDKAWPMRNVPPQAQHINWDHIYGTYDDRCLPAVDAEEDEEAKEERHIVPTEATDATSKQIAPVNSHSRSYYDTWPIPLNTSKQDLKASRQLAQIQRHYLSNPSEHPVVLLAIHLCGTLSLRAVELFNANPAIRFFALKPCCLPGMVHAKRREVFRIGSHAFEASEVCVHGRWNKNRWENGPPRSHLQKKFKIWSRHLYRGIGHGLTSDKDAAVAAAKGDELDSGGDFESQKSGSAECDEPVRKTHARIRVQHEGGFQNDFLFAERTPISCASVWHGLDQYSLDRTIESEGL